MKHTVAFVDHDREGWGREFARLIVIEAEFHVAVGKLIDEIGRCFEHSVTAPIPHEDASSSAAVRF